MGNFRIITHPIVFDLNGNPLSTKFISTTKMLDAVILDKSDIFSPQSILEALHHKEKALNTEAACLYNEFFVRKLEMEENNRQRPDYLIEKKLRGSLPNSHLSIVDEDLNKKYWKAKNEFERFLLCRNKMVNLTRKVYAHKENFAKQIYNKFTENERYLMQSENDEENRKARIAKLNEGLAGVNSELIRTVENLNGIVYIFSSHNAVVGKYNGGVVFPENHLIMLNQLYCYASGLIQEEFVHFVSCILGMIDYNKVYKEAIFKDYNKNENGVQEFINKYSRMTDKFDKNKYSGDMLPAELRPELYNLRIKKDPEMDKQLDLLFPNTLPFIDDFIQKIKKIAEGSDLGFLKENKNKSTTGLSSFLFIR